MMATFGYSMDISFYQQTCCHVGPCGALRDARVRVQLAERMCT